MMVHGCSWYLFITTYDLYYYIYNDINMLFYVIFTKGNVFRRILCVFLGKQMFFRVSTVESADVYLCGIRNVLFFSHSLPPSLSLSLSRYMLILFAYM